MVILSITNKLQLSRTIYKDWWEPAVFFVTDLLVKADAQIRK